MEKKKGFIKKMFSFYKKKVDDKKIETGRKIEAGKKIETKATRAVAAANDIANKMATVRAAKTTVRTSEDVDSSFGLADLGGIAITGIVIVATGTIVAVAGTAYGGYQLLKWLSGLSSSED